MEFLLQKKKNGPKGYSKKIKLCKNLNKKFHVLKTGDPRMFPSKTKKIFK
jgi:hypothetical protein